MKNVEHDRIDEQEYPVKDVEERFVCLEVAPVALEGIDDAVDVSNEDEHVARVEEVDYRAHSGSQNPRLEATDMEDHFQSDEAAEEADLQE